VTIKSGSFIGSGTVIRENITIGKNSIIGAGLTIKKNIKPFSLVK
jgi:acetyltransferase-like isoleucine patch superfamily enzyme